MTLALITVICTKCGEELHLPQHVADLPAHARLCAVCVRALLRGVEKPTWQTHSCVNHCVLWAAGAPHKCPPGTCKRYDQAMEKWEAEQAVAVRDDLRG